MYLLKKKPFLSYWLPRALGILLILTLLVSILPVKALASPQKATACKPSYQIRRNDTLSNIGRLYGVNPNQIVLINNMNYPYTIYVGQNICIPTTNQSGAPKLENKQLNAPAVYFTAGRAGDILMIYAYNYPKTNVIVRVQNANNPQKNLTTIGKITQILNGKTYRLKLPGDLQKASRLFVCLKDRTTSYLQCTYPRSGP